MRVDTVGWNKAIVAFHGLRCGYSWYFDSRSRNNGTDRELDILRLSYSDQRNRIGIDFVGQGILLLLNYCLVIRLFLDRNVLKGNLSLEK